MVFSTSSINYVCRYGGSGYLGQTTESERLFFRSATLAPRSGLRVRIWNVSGVFAAGAVPYTDREYDKGVRTEGFDVRPGTGHEGRYFIVSTSQLNPVVNSFRYEILDSSAGATAVVEQGQFEGQFFERFVGNRTVFDDPVYCPFSSPFPRPGPYPFPSPYPWPY